MSRGRIVLTLVCIFMALVLIFGIVFGTVLIVRNAKAVLSYGNVRIGEDEAYFLSAFYKYSFLIDYASDGAEDTPEFWNSAYDDDKTYGELLREGIEKYVRETVVKAYLFDKFCDFDTLDEIKVKKAVKQILDFRASGSEAKFNEIYAKYGFDFEDFQNMAAVLYKAAVVRDRIYGENGESASRLTSECNKYFENYSHVKLLFIRTEDTYVLDGEGNLTFDEKTGEPITISLTDSEKAQRQALLAEIRASVKAFEDKSDDYRMTPEYFDTLLSKHNEELRDRNQSGHYFLAESSYTAAFIRNKDGTADLQRAEIVKRALSMKKDSYAELAYEGGVCFIYKYENTPMAYTDTSADGFFPDFYSLVAAKTFSDAVSDLSSEVKVKNKFSDIDIIAMPSDKMFIPRF